MNKIGVKTNLTSERWEQELDRLSHVSPHLVQTQIQQLQQTREFSPKISVTQFDKSPVPVTPQYHISPPLFSIAII